MTKKGVAGLCLMIGFTLVAGASRVYADSDEGESVGEHHQKEVAKVVLKLEKIADKDTNIETEVKDVAEVEKSASERVKEKMDAVDSRGGFKTFLIGSDYKDLGELKSELVNTDNDLDKLNKALLKSKEKTVKSDLQTEINELTTIKTKANDFVQSLDEKFSLFGWLVRMFQ